MSYTHLTPEDRYVIYHLRVFKLSYREIGRRLGRSHTTIHTTIQREVRRNGPDFGGVYYYGDAHSRRGQVLSFAFRLF